MVKRSNRRESSVLRGWLSSFYSDDDATGSAKAAARRRLILAFALAVAIHEIIAGVFPWHTQQIPPMPAEKITIAKLTRIEHRPRPTPKPTPRPTPKPTPIVVHTKVIAPTHVKPHIVNPGNPSQHHHIKRVASARPLIRTHYHSKPAPVHVPMGGHGAGTSTKAKVETGGVGPGGTGTGESGSGQGTGGAPEAHEPCGYVEFLPIQEARVDQATGRVWEYVAIRVHFPDGTQDTLDLDYPFYYPTGADDPFMAGHDNIPATFQFPPPNQRGGEPALVQYVIDHTTPDGYTLLHDCPK